jgi:hypothetical protein
MRCCRKQCPTYTEPTVVQACLVLARAAAAYTAVGRASRCAALRCTRTAKRLSASDRTAGTACHLSVYRLCRAASLDRSWALGTAARTAWLVPHGAFYRYTPSPMRSPSPAHSSATAAKSELSKASTRCTITHSLTL